VASTTTFPNTVTTGDILIATGTNVVSSLADVAVGQVLVSGGVGVGPSYTSSPSVAGSITAGTSVTASNGDIRISGPGKTLIVRGGTNTDMIGQVTLTNGSATILNPNITALDYGFFIVLLKNASTAYGVAYMVTITPGVSWTVTSTRTDTNIETNDQSTLGFWFVRETLT
jgi:hypothetical protein